MRIPTAALAASFTAAFVSACGGAEKKEQRYESGHKDGYAVGYNSTCEIRATLIEGDWSDPDYSRGYAQGNVAGSAACQSDRRRGDAE